MPKNLPRLTTIDMMVGIAMILVVLGHLSVGFEPEWYSHGLHNWIYSFHMEMFFFLSAFLIRYSYKPVKSILEYTQYIWRKFKKFFLGYIIIGMAVVLLACAFKDATFSGSYLLQSLRTILLYPRYGEAAFLWYIYLLFGFYLISPLFFRLPQWGRVVLCVATLFLAMVDAGPLFATRDFCKYLFFYCLGTLCAEWIEEIRSVKPWQWALLSLPFVAYSVWVFSEGRNIGFEFPQLGWWSTVTGVSALPFFYLLSGPLSKTKIIREALTLISVNCYWIYLFQMFIIWGCAALVIKFLDVQTFPFAIFLVVASLLAIVLPILAAKIITKWFGKSVKSV